MSKRPPPLRTDGSNAFAHNTMRIRVPGIIREVQTLNPDYPALIQKALDTLREEMIGNAPLKMLDLPAPDYDEWVAMFAPYKGQNWLNTEWFFAEVFFYRYLMQITRWWETGRDPFAPKKAEEIASAPLWQLLGEALSFEAEDTPAYLSILLHFALWGNRIDLSYALAASHGRTVNAGDLLVDEGLHAAEQILRSPGTIHVIADNAGSELAMDLVLANWLLSAGRHVIFHLKMHPTFVSDATVADVLALLNALEKKGASARQLSVRLCGALNDGRLRLAPDLYWNSTRFFWDMPPRLMRIFHNAALVIIKGDANYRRLVGDALWPYDASFQAVMSYFHPPLVALRTLKSDPVVGLPTGLASELETIDKEWRVNGRRGIIQFKPATR